MRITQADLLVSEGESQFDDTGRITLFFAIIIKLKLLIVVRMHQSRLISVRQIAHTRIRSPRHLL
jgi:hypothetical protein